MRPHFHYPFYYTINFYKCQVRMGATADQEVGMCGNSRSGTSIGSYGADSSPDGRGKVGRRRCGNQVAGAEGGRIGVTRTRCLCKGV